jgi:hypothetical protein
MHLQASETLRVRIDTNLHAQTVVVYKSYTVLTFCLHHAVVLYYTRLRLRLYTGFE